MLTQQAIDRLAREIEERIPLFVAKREEAAVQFLQAKQVYAKELESSKLAERDAQPPTSSKEAFGVLSRRMDMWVDFEERKMAIDFPYRNLILNSLKEAGERAKLDVQ